MALDHTIHTSNGSLWKWVITCASFQAACVSRRTRGAKWASKRKTTTRTAGVVLCCFYQLFRGTLVFFWPIYLYNVFWQFWLSKSKLVASLTLWPECYIAFNALSCLIVCLCSKSRLFCVIWKSGSSVDDLVVALVSFFGWHKSPKILWNVSFVQLPQPSSFWNIKPTKNIIKPTYHFNKTIQYQHPPTSP